MTITERTRLIRQLARTTGTDPAALTPHTLTVFLASIDSPVTADAYYSIARAWCTWLVRAGHRDDDPTMRVPRPRVPPARPRPITRNQLDTLLATPLRQDTRTKILLAAYAGLRIHEIAKLKGQDIDPAGGTLTVTGKGGRTDLLPAHPVILDQAASYPSKGYWFPSPNRPGQHVAAKTVGTVIARALRRAGIDATAHQPPRSRHRQPHRPDPHETRIPRHHRPLPRRHPHPTKGSPRQPHNRCQCHPRHRLLPRSTIRTSLDSPMSDALKRRNPA